jgi:hypothetical protein
MEISRTIIYIAYISHHIFPIRVIRLAQLIHLDLIITVILDVEYNL